MCYEQGFHSCSNYSLSPDLLIKCSMSIVFIFVCWMFQSFVAFLLCALQFSCFSCNRRDLSRAAEFNSRTLKCLAFCYPKFQSRIVISAINCFPFALSKLIFWVLFHILLWKLSLVFCVSPRMRCFSKSLLMSDW